MSNNNKTTAYRKWFLTYVIDILPLVMGLILYVSYVFNLSYYRRLNIDINEYLDFNVLLNSFLIAIYSLIVATPIIIFILPFCFYRRYLEKRNPERINFSLCLAASAFAFLIIGVIPYVILLNYVAFDFQQYYTLWPLCVAVFCFCTIDIHIKNKTWYKPRFFLIVSIIFSVSIMHFCIKSIGRSKAAYDIKNRQKICFTITTESGSYTNDNNVYFDVLGNSTLIYNYKDNKSIVVPKDRIIQLEIRN